MKYFCWLCMLTTSLAAHSGCEETLKVPVAQEFERISGLALPLAELRILSTAGTVCPPGNFASSQLHWNPLGLRFDAKTNTYYGNGYWQEMGNGKRMPLNVHFSAPPLLPIARLKVAVKTGQEIPKRALEEIMIFWRPLPANLAPLGAASTAGMRARRHLPAGSVVRAADLTSPSAVSRGQILQAEKRAGEALLRFPVIAIDSANLGDSLRVRKPGSAQIYSAQLDPSGRVTILAAGDMTFEQMEQVQPRRDLP
jgi:flagella basal body P-ring formation protein FlgA